MFQPTDLEISKPQKNTRPAPPSTDTPRGSQGKRPKSPEYVRSGPGGRNSRGQGDRYEMEQNRVPFSDFRDEHPLRRRDDYRPFRSPSPRGFRGRDRDRSPPERYGRRDRRRSRSPPYFKDRRYRSPSPRPRNSYYESDADLPVARRAPWEVPDVQVLVLEDIDRLVYCERCIAFHYFFFFFFCLFTKAAQELCFSCREFTPQSWFTGRRSDARPSHPAFPSGESTNK